MGLLIVEVEHTMCIESGHINQGLSIKITLYDNFQDSFLTFEWILKI